MKKIIIVSGILFFWVTVCLTKPKKDKVKQWHNRNAIKASLEKLAYKISEHEKSLDKSGFEDSIEEVTKSRDYKKFIKIADSNPQAKDIINGVYAKIIADIF